MKFPNSCLFTNTHRIIFLALNGADIIARGCNELPMKNECAKEKNKGEKAVLCVCDTSLCNSASRKYFPVVFVVIVFVALLI